MCARLQQVPAEPTGRRSCGLFAIEVDGGGGLRAATAAGPPAARPLEQPGRPLMRRVLNNAQSGSFSANMTSVAHPGSRPIRN